MEEPAPWWYNGFVKKQNNTVDYSTPIQLKLPVDLEKIIKINDPVFSFSEVMAHIDLQKYFVEKGHETGRPRYDREKLLKIILFAFMKFGDCSVRFIHKLCETDIRFLWLLDEEKAPSHMTISNFIHKEISGSLEEKSNAPKKSTEDPIPGILRFLRAVSLQPHCDFYTLWVKIPLTNPVSISNTMPIFPQDCQCLSESQQKNRSNCIEFSVFLRCNWTFSRNWCILRRKDFRRGCHGFRLAP